MDEDFTHHNYILHKCKEKLDSMLLRQIVTLILVGTAMILIAIVLCAYYNGVDEKTVTIDQGDYIVTSCEVLREPQTLILNNAKLINKSEMTYLGLLMDGMTDFNVYIAEIRDLYNSINDLTDYARVEDMEIVIPEKAARLGSTEDDASIRKNLEEYDIYEPIVALYSWDKKYVLKKGDKYVEKNMVLVLDEYIIYEHIKKPETTSLLDKFIIEVYCGTVDESEIYLE